MPRTLDYPYEDLKPTEEEANGKEEKESMLRGEDHVVDMKDARKELEFSVE